MSKVIHFPPRISVIPAASSDSDISKERVSAIVHSLVKPQGIFHVYEERFTGRDVAAREFFAVLSEVRSVSIVNKKDLITGESILRIEKKTGQRDELGVSAFIRLTESTPGMVTDDEIERYMTTTLVAADLQIGKLTEAEDTFSDSEMTHEEAQEFLVDEIDALFEDGYYACGIDSSDGSGRSFTLDDFALQDVKLLVLLAHAYEVYFGEGCIVDDEDINIELSRCEGMHTHTTLIPFGLFQELILSAISRKYPLYDNYPTDKRIKRFYEDNISKILSEEFLNGEFEEE